MATPTNTFCRLCTTVLRIILHFQDLCLHAQILSAKGHFQSPSTSCVTHAAVVDLVVAFSIVIKTFFVYEGLVRSQ